MWQLRYVYGIFRRWGGGRWATRPPPGGRVARECYGNEGASEAACWPVHGHRSTAGGTHRHRAGARAARRPRRPRPPGPSRRKPTPNFILPFYPAQLCSVDNIEQFQFLMYRPLYWFGVGTTPDLNTSLSVGQTPTFSNGDTTVTVDLKNYKWSNGESVTAQDVLFFMNIYHAEKANFCGYVQGRLPRQRDQRHRQRPDR